MKMKSVLGGFAPAKKATRGYTQARRDQAAEAFDKAKDEGLKPVGKWHALYRSLNIGEERATAYLPGKKGTQLGKVRTQWWAPAAVVHFDDVLLKCGFSQKLRAKALRCFADGRPVPERFHGALARYTEEVFNRR